jgi:hypothetical protein
MELGERDKEKENDRETITLPATRCEGRGYKNAY